MPCNRGFGLEGGELGELDMPRRSNPRLAALPNVHRKATHSARTLRALAFDRIVLLYQAESVPSQHEHECTTAMHPITFQEFPREAPELHDSDDAGCLTLVNVVYQSVRWCVDFLNMIGLGQHDESSVT